MKRKPSLSVIINLRILSGLEHHHSSALSSLWTFLLYCTTRRDIVHLQQLRQQQLQLRTVINAMSKVQSESCKNFSIFVSQLFDWGRIICKSKPQKYNSFNTSQERPPQLAQSQLEHFRHCLKTASSSLNTKNGWHLILIIVMKGTAMLTTVRATLQTPISSLSKRQKLLVFLWAAILPRPSHKVILRWWLMSSQMITSKYDKTCQHDTQCLEYVFGKAYGWVLNTSWSRISSFSRHYTQYNF